MKQLSTRTLAIISLIAIAILALGVFVIQRVYNTPLSIVKNKVEQKENPKTNNETFITDVDMNIDNWQTKETKFFTIKFPKEWYWLESKHGESEGYSEIITNNPNFEIDKYADIGLFTEGKYLFTSVSEGAESESIPLQNDEVVISFRGTPTSNSGTPQDSMNSKMTKRSVNDYDCGQDNTKTLPLRGHCFFTTDYNEKIYTHYVITEKISLAITARTTANTMIANDVTEKIAGSIEIQ